MNKPVLLYGYTLQDHTTVLLVGREFGPDSELYVGKNRNHLEKVETTFYEMPRASEQASVLTQCLHIADEPAHHALMKASLTGTSDEGLWFVYGQLLQAAGLEESCMLNFSDDAVDITWPSRV